MNRQGKPGQKLSGQLPENDGLSIVAVFDMPVHRPCKHNVFDIPAYPRHLLRGEAVIDSFNRLFDDRASVEVCDHIVCRCADKLDP